MRRARGQLQQLQAKQSLTQSGTVIEKCLPGVAKCVTECVYGGVWVGV